MALTAKDFKQFKYKAHDSGSVTLLHPAGHEIKIATKGVKGALREQLEAICKDNAPKEEACGGPVKMANGGLTPTGSPTQDAIGAQAQPVPQTIAPDALQPAGIVPDYRDPMQITQSAAPDNALAGNPDLEAAKMQYNRMVFGVGGDPFAQNIPYVPGKMFGPKGELPEDVDPKMWEQSKFVTRSIKEREDLAQQESAASAAAEIEAKNKARAEVGLPPLESPAAPDTGGMAPVAEAAGIAPAPATDAATTAPDQSTMAAAIQGPTGLEQAVSGSKAEAVAKANLGEAQYRALKNQEKAIATAKTKYDEQFSALNAEREGLIADINNGQIDPDKFWDNHSRLAAGIGMIIAGFDPAGRPNAAVNYLKVQMEQNLDAQKTNLGAKKSLLEANLRQFGNIKDAMDMTRIMQADLLSNQLAQAAAKSANPMAQAAADKAIGALRMEYEPKMLELAAKRAAMGLSMSAAQDPSQGEAAIAAMELVDPKKAEDMRGRFVPGFGFAPTKDDAKAVKEVENRRANIRTNAESIIKMVKDKGTYELLGPHNENLNALSEQIATDMAKLQDPSSVARPSEVEQVKKNLIEAGLSKTNVTAQKIIEHFYKTVEQRANEAYKIHGVPPPKSKPLNEGEIKTMGGVEYKRVSGGWQKVKNGQP